ncbi:isocitrate lyase/phosphoenolpyruvate mutase family protein, partial [Pseudomonas sp. PCH446]
MDTQTFRAHAFKALHERAGAFVIANPWDAGSAKMLAALGFEALATTSAAWRFPLGVRMRRGQLAERYAGKRAGIVLATTLPVAADLENGFAHSPAGCAEAILRAAEVGLVGGSIEDASGHADDPIYASPRRR